jgi:hypothetical protein
LADSKKGTTSDASTGLNNKQIMKTKPTNRLTLDELIKKFNPCRARPSDEEHNIQTQCVEWFNTEFPNLKGRLFAVPNGGRRDKRTAAKLKAEGVVAGVSDLILLLPNKSYGALLIELKTPKGRQSP